jgi:mRNA-degrading endonuclease RelE of RelBE toxin-antitoxin system
MTSSAFVWATTRVVYTIDDLNMLVDITRIRHRKEVYER